MADIDIRNVEKALQDRIDRIAKLRQELEDTNNENADLKKELETKNAAIDSLTKSLDSTKMALNLKKYPWIQTYVGIRTKSVVIKWMVDHANVSNQNEDNIHIYDNRAILLNPYGENDTFLSMDNCEGTHTLYNYSSGSPELYWRIEKHDHGCVFWSKKIAGYCCLKEDDIWDSNWLAVRLKMIDTNVTSLRCGHLLVTLEDKKMTVSFKNILTICDIDYGQYNGSMFTYSSDKLTMAGYYTRNKAQAIVYINSNKCFMHLVDRMVVDFSDKEHYFLYDTGSRRIVMLVDNKITYLYYRFVTFKIENKKKYVITSSDIIDLDSVFYG